MLSSLLVRCCTDSVVCVRRYVCLFVCFFHRFSLFSTEEKKKLAHNIARPHHFPHISLSLSLSTHRSLLLQNMDRFLRPLSSYCRRHWRMCLRRSSFHNSKRPNVVTRTWPSSRYAFTFYARASSTHPRCSSPRRLFNSSLEVIENHSPRSWARRAISLDPDHALARRRTPRTGTRSCCVE
jgi:hypothetical protein